MTKGPPQNRRSFTSIVQPARPGTKSLRVTLPMGAATALDVRPGDVLVWEPGADGKQIRLLVTKSVR